MNIHSLIIDDFFSKPEEVRNVALRGNRFGETVNPNDGVTYPDVAPCDQLEILTEASMNLVKLFEQAFIPKTAFFRLSTFGVKAPHGAHTDVAMGQYTLIVYLSDPHPKLFCGTSILEHVSEQMPAHPRTEYEMELWSQDTNIYEKWKIVGFCPMKFNRAFLVKSDLFHRAEPINGIGRHPYDGRLIFGCFFDLK